MATHQGGGIIRLIIGLGPLGGTRRDVREARYRAGPLLRASMVRPTMAACGNRALVPWASIPSPPSNDWTKR
jgi:hypothetical protein